jgi:aminopeptidase N
MKSQPPRAIKLKDYKPPSHLIERVDITVDLDAQRTRVRAKLAVRPTAWISNSTAFASTADGWHRAPSSRAKTV